MSLYLLNEHRTDVAADYRRNVESSRGPSRVATARGDEVRRGGPRRLLHRLRGARVRRLAASHHRRVPRGDPRGARPAGLPADLEDAMESDDYDAAMRRSHDAGMALVGGEVGHADHLHRRGGVLRPGSERDPARRQAVEVFEGARLLAGYPQFYELKRTRMQPAGLHLKEER